MRKLVIWALIVALVLGFVYIGGNLLEAIGIGNCKGFNTRYLPYADAVLLSPGGENAAGMFFPSLTLPLPRSDGKGETIYLYKNSLSKIRIKETYDTNVSPVDRMLYDFNKSGFSTNFYWENGFPVIDASRVNEEFFSSVWRRWEFASSNKETLQSMFSAILQKGRLLTDNPDFQMLWQDPSDRSFYGIAFENAKSAFTEKLQIPFFGFSYPLFFSYDENKKEFEADSSSNSPKGSLLFNPFDFGRAVLEIAEPETGAIKKLITGSGLQMIISEKLGLPFEKFSLFSSMDSGEFVLFDQNDFLFAVKSTPVSNTLYRSEIMQVIPKVKAANKNTGGFSLVSYSAPNVRFYTLETPTMFIISTKKDILEQIASGAVFTRDVGNTALFIRVKKEFNDVATLYSLNTNPLKLPEFAASCTLTQTRRGGKLITKISFGK